MLADFNPFTPAVANPFDTALVPPNLTPGSGLVTYPGGAPSGFFAFIPTSSDVPLPPISGANLKTEMRGLRLAAAGKIPLGAKFALNIQGGALLSEYEVTSSYFLPDPVSCCAIPIVVSGATVKETEKNRDPELFLGLGFTWNISQSISTKLFWEKYLDFGEGKYFEQDLDSYNLSLRYRF